MAWKLHNAMWPGLVGKEEGSDEPPISLEEMLTLTEAAEVDGKKYDGVDLFLYQPHLDIDAPREEIQRLAARIAKNGLQVGTVVAPIWADTGGGRALGSQEERKAFVDSVRKACRYAQVLREEGVRTYGNIRIDSACSVKEWLEDSTGNTKKIAETFKEAAKVAADFDEVLVAEGEICWGGMHSWTDMLNLLEEVGMPERVGFQADLAHTYLYLLGYNAPESALLTDADDEEAFYWNYSKMVSNLAPWTYDFHVAQNDGTVFGSGAHDKTGRHCLPYDVNGKLDIARCASFWLYDSEGQPRKDIAHICWDGCMFPNEQLRQEKTWNDVLEVMLGVNSFLAEASLSDS